MKRFVLLFTIVSLLSACTAQVMDDCVPQDSLVPKDKVFGLDLPRNAVDPVRLNVLFDEETAAELERMTSQDGYVQLPQVKSFSSNGIVRMRRLFPEAGRFEARTREAGLHRWYEVYYDTSVSITKAATGWVAIPGVEYVELNPSLHIVGDPVLVREVTAPPQTATSGPYPFNDPRLPSQWSFYNKGTVASSAPGCDINIFPVWERFTTGSPEVIIGVVDGGIDYNHEDLAANMWHNPEMQGDSQYGYNFAADSYTINPENHGTHVAGTIAAVNNNGIGVCGVAGGDAAKGQPGVKLMSCQIFDGSNSGSGAAAIKWSADHGAVISQNSWGFEHESETPKSLVAAVDYFIKNAGIDENGFQTGPMRGGLVIFAAGNENTNRSGNSYEAIFDVAAVGADYRRAYYSNYGDWVDISAPGGDARKGNQVMSTIVNNKYGVFQGTSMSCPMVSGVAALLISLYQGEGLTPDVIERKLTESATPISSFNKNYKMGAGLLDAYRAFAGSGGQAPGTPTMLKASVKSNNISISVLIPEDGSGGTPDALYIYYNKVNFSTITPDLMFAKLYLDGMAPGDTLETTLTGFDFNTVFYLAAAAGNLSGAISDLSQRMSVTTRFNTPPVIEALGSTELTIKPSEKGSLDFKVYDADGHFYLIDFKNDTPGIYLDTLVRDCPKIVANGPEIASGSYSAKLEVTDIYGAAAIQDVLITVLENHAPRVKAAIDDKIFSGKERTDEIDCRDYFTDDDGEDLKYSFSIDNETVIAMSGEGGRYRLTPLDYGYATVTVTASDVRGESASQSFRVLVRDVRSNVDIYPNPVSDFLYVRTSSAATASLKLIDVLGMTVYEKTLTITPFEPAKVDMTAFPSGIYTLILNMAGETTTGRIYKR